MGERFKPSRGGVINVWDYVDEEWAFADGRLALRGHNGSGKTKALEVLFPFVLDGVADSRRLEQAVANLIENALVHGAAPVVVDATEGDAEIIVSVRDHGPGVAESLIPTLFSRIRTLGRWDRDRARGTGLGLALVRGLVEAMGGRVWYEAAPDGGAVFYLALATPRSRRP